MREWEKKEWEKPIEYPDYHNFLAMIVKDIIILFLIATAVVVFIDLFS